MALSDLIKKGVALANTMTQDLQASITWEASDGEDSYGNPQFATAQSLTVLIEQKRRFLGIDQMQQSIYADTKVTVLRGDITFSPQDRITLPNGKTPRLLDVKTMLDKDGNPYMTELFF